LPELAEQFAGDHRFAPRAMPLRIGAERRQIDDRQVGNKTREILARRADQEVADEQRVPGVFREHARPDP
jgi:hypothetical protein